MTEKTLQLDIPLVLPGVEAEDDACLTRLEFALQNQKGLQRAHIEHDKTPITLCLHYDPDLLSLVDVKRLAERAGAWIVNRYHHQLVSIEGMDCSDCARVVEHSVGRIDGVLAVNVNYAAQKMRVEYDGYKTSQSAIEKRVRSLGYSIPTNGLWRVYHDHRELLFSLASGLLLLIGFAGAQWLAFPFEVSLTCYLGAYALGGWDTARHAWHALRERRFDTDLLMIVAALGAAALGDFAEGALLLFLFSLGHALEQRALNRARKAIESLAELAPKTAVVRRDGGEVEAPVDELQIDEVVIVRSGVRIPVDGEVSAGQSSVNQAPVTGESTPVDKTPGDKVYAGSVNGEGVLDVRVTRLAKDSTLARVMKMVEEAQTQKSPTQQKTERFTRIFVPAVLIVDALAIIVPPFFGVAFADSFLRAMTLLVAASPCALALGTPAAILTGIAQAARQGVLVKGGVYLENLGRVKAIAFDKTGTLTYGRPDVIDVAAYAMARDDLLSLAAAVERQSAHPLAQAVVRAAAPSSNGSSPEVDQVEALTGRGVRARVDGQAVTIGALKLMADDQIDLPEDARRQIEAWESSGKTTMLVAVDHHLAGALALADAVRPAARPAMSALKRLGVAKTVMLTGDNARVAGAIAGQVGVSDYRADLMPEDKLTAIRELNQSFGQVAMVGDGVNDAPALARATVGIALGGASTDVALETADVALMSDDLLNLPFAVGLGRATGRVITQNLIVALGVIGLLACASLIGWAGIGAAIVLHEGSTLVVVLNALRLLGYRPPRFASP